jgi:WD40 repeat protein/serine/threonine protein kinase
MDNLAGHNVKGYELRERIGAGGFGAVYKAYQSTIGREVAMKIILPRFANHPDFIRRFETEAQLVARLEHLHIVPLYDYWRDPDGAYLIMRWLKGGSLRDALQQSPFQPETAALLLDQIAAALSAAHRAGVIHRDLKPANILIDEDGNAYLGDFGIAKDLTNLQGGGTEADAIIGSPDYIAPEQARAEPVTPATDIYSLGVTLYEVLTGQHPFPDLTPVERMFKHLNDPLPLITTLKPEISDAVNAVIQKATAKNPAHRYTDVIEMAVAFREALGTLRQPSGTSILQNLTLREQDILQLVIDGRSNKEIAQELFITLATVKWYIRQIYIKLGVRSRVQAIVRARELNLINRQGAVEGTSSFEIAIEPENPYKGLRAFTAADHKDYFGREKITDKLVKRLGETTDLARFLAVVGPSGSGKSSLVKAGLIPAIWKGALPNSEKWFVIEMLPGARPLDELEIALTKVAANHTGNIHEHLERDEFGLNRVASLLLPNDGSDLVLVIDQFEEVFTLVEDEKARQHFLNLLHHAVTQPRSRVRVVVTLRADFYDRPLHYPQFGELVRSRMETVLPLSADELERAIAKPAEQVGVKFEPGLVASIVSEVNYQPGALPLLQYALTELFERRDKRTLIREAYQAIGGTVGALAKRADEIYLDLDDAGKEAARQMFLRLVTLGEGTEDTRRRVARSELLAIAVGAKRDAPSSDAADLMDDVIDTYAEYRLLSLDNDPGTRTPTVEVAHEAILREWERLRVWLNESREDVRLQRQVMTLAAEWHGAKQDASFLLRGARLEVFEKWIQETQLALTEKERAYVEASLTQRTKEESDEKTRQARELKLAKDTITAQKRAANRLRLLVAVLVVAVLGALGLSGVAVSNATEAQNARATSDANFAQAQELSLVNGAQAALVNGNGDLARALAVVANRGANPSGQAQVMLGEAAYAPGTVHLYREPSGGSWGVVFNPDGRTAVTVNELIIFWDLNTGEELRHISAPGRTVAHNREWLIFSPDGSSIAMPTDYNIDFIDVETGEVLRTLSGHTNVVRSVNFSPDGQTLVSGSLDNTLIVWDMATGTPLRTLSGHEDDIQSVAYSPDGTRIISSSDDTTLILWDAAKGEIIHRFNEDHSVYQNPTMGAMFSPDGRTIAASSQTSLTSWDAQTFELIWQVETGFSMRLTMSHDGRHILVGSGNHARLFDAADGSLVMTLQGHTAEVIGVDLSADDRYAVTSSFDGTIRLWDLHYGAQTAPPMELVGGGAHVALSHDGVYMLVSSSNGDEGLLTLYDVASGAEISRFGSDGIAFRNLFFGWRFLPVAFSPDGQYAISSAMTVEQEEIVTIDETGAETPQTIETTPVFLVLWDVATGTIVHEYGPIPINPFRDYNEEITALQFHPDGRSFIAVSRDENVTVWDVESGTLLRSFGHYDGSYSAVFSPDGRTVLMGETANTIGLWDFESGELIRRFGAFRTPHTIRIRTVTFSPDGRYFASGDDNSLIIVWDVETGQVLHRFVGHQGGIWSLDFNADGTQMLSGSTDGVIILWDVATGQAIRRYTEHTLNIRDIFFIDNQTFISLSEDGTLRRWRVDSPSELLAWTYANRYVPELTCTERELYRLETICIDDVYPTRTPYVLPTLLPTSVGLPFNPTLTPTAMPAPLLMAELGDNRGEVTANGGQRWLFYGSAGESYTISVIADHPITDGYQFQDEAGNPLLSSVLAIYQTNGVLLNLVGWEEDPIITIENFVLPATGDYVLEVRDHYYDGSGGAYTLAIERVQPDVNEEASAETTAAP